MFNKTIHGRNFAFIRNIRYMCKIPIYFCFNKPCPFIYSIQFVGVNIALLFLIEHLLTSIHNLNKITLK